MKAGYSAHSLTRVALHSSATGVAQSVLFQLCFYSAEPVSFPTRIRPYNISNDLIEPQSDNR